MSSLIHRRRFEPDARVIELVRLYGAPRVALMYGLPADTVRRYADGACQRANRWWIELHLDTVSRDLAAAARPARTPIRLVSSSSDNGGSA